MQTATSTSSHAASTTASHPTTTTGQVLSTKTPGPTSSESDSSLTPLSNPPTETPNRATGARGSSSLTSAQAIGVSVAAVGAVIIAIVIAYITLCVRRKKAKRAKAERHSYDFVDEGPSTTTAVEDRFIYRTDGSGTGSTAEKHRTVWPGQFPRTIRQVQEPMDNAQTNPLGPASEHRNSHEVPSPLLPDKPRSRPLPPKPPPKSPLCWPQTPATIFEEERIAPLPAALLPGLPAHPAVNKHREPTSMPSLSLNIPERVPRYEAVQKPNGYTLPAPPRIHARSSSRSHSRSSKSSLLDYYAGTDSGSPEDLYSSTPIESQAQVRRPPPAAITITKPACPPQAVRNSIVSTDSRRTSFESTDPDEPTPPEEQDKQLSPVAESPIAAIRYPKIPRSSNQAVPRSPGGGISPRAPEAMAGPRTSSLRHARATEKPFPVTPERQMLRAHSPNLSGSTLAAKRRGSVAAEALEHSIHILNSAHAPSTQKVCNKTWKSPIGNEVVGGHRHESPLKGYGRVASRQQPNWPLTVATRTPESRRPLKSPLWEPKLTPSRMGDDLYLRVSAATPQQAHFPSLYNAR
ncbi:hypothetical protein HII31_03169 [Pseudocercospora fuligena]|uniref:Uncharacterized protein n=1 Tax=Pseudocercospora fuligena TaxID=685502 RepID=A0A8H6VQU7_9PEZI|nr:hypothetical protein HII31_03169 [Pseudocercospora fuligena]